MRLTPIKEPCSQTKYIAAKKECGRAHGRARVVPQANRVGGCCSAAVRCGGGLLVAGRRAGECARSAIAASVHAGPGGKRNASAFSGSDADGCTRTGGGTQFHPGARADRDAGSDTDLHACTHEHGHANGYAHTDEYADSDVYPNPDSD